MCLAGNWNRAAHSELREEVALLEVCSASSFLAAHVHQGNVQSAQGETKGSKVKQGLSVAPQLLRDYELTGKF